MGKYAIIVRAESSENALTISHMHRGNFNHVRESANIAYETRRHILEGRQAIHLLRICSGHYGHVIII